MGYWMTDEKITDSKDEDNELDKLVENEKIKTPLEKDWDNPHDERWNKEKIFLVKNLVFDTDTDEYVFHGEPIIKELTKEEIEFLKEVLPSYHMLKRQGGWEALAKAKRIKQSILKKLEGL